MTVRSSLDQLIDVAAKLPPGPEAWAPIFEHYPKPSAADVARLFREAEARDLRKPNRCLVRRAQRCRVPNTAKKTDMDIVNSRLRLLIPWAHLTCGKPDDADAIVAYLMRRHDAGDL